MSTQGQHVKTIGDITLVVFPGEEDCHYDINWIVTPERCDGAGITLPERDDEFAKRIAAIVALAYNAGINDGRERMRTEYRQLLGIE